jgi:hypothetical protein
LQNGERKYRNSQQKKHRVKQSSREVSHGSG